MSVIADAKQFNWDELYVKLFKYGNKGQRTGPWDFDETNDNRPLMPSYWVSVDGRRIGLWFFQRVSLEDIERRRFRSKTAFHLASDGNHNIILEPYRPFVVEWLSARLEPDPEDRLLPPAGLRHADGNVSAAKWSEETFWPEQRRRLETTHCIYCEPLRRSFDWVAGVKPDVPQDAARKSAVAEDIQLLIAAHYLENRPGALEQALQILDQMTALPHWGNPREDAYSHNGDMGAGFTMRALAMALHMFGNRLGADRRKRLLDKLTLQGNRFFELALLNHDYWGGSLIQDHGWQSMFAFGTAALHLYGIIPEAELWLAYVIPRLDRALAAMPRDGVIPAGSYYTLAYYTEEASHYRNTLLELSGRDIFDAPEFRLIVPFVASVLKEDETVMLVGGHGDRHDLTSGGMFMNIMAAKHRDAVAAQISRAIAENRPKSFYHSRQMGNHYYGMLNAFMTYDPCVAPAPAVLARRHLLHFEDSCFVHYRDDALGVVLALRCGPLNGRHAYLHSLCSCDRLGDAPGAGHFALFLDGVPLLVTPEAGYCLHSFHRSCLLVDDNGQYGDIGYPMSLPDVRDRGEQIVGTRWNEATGKGLIRLDLKPAYPGELDMVAYQRDFIITGGRRIICRDHVVFNSPHRLAWLFHGKREYGVALDGLIGRFGKEPKVSLAPHPTGFAVQAALRETEIVWSYASTGGFKPFDYVRYDASRPLSCAVIDFELTW